MKDCHLAGKFITIVKPFLCSFEISYVISECISLKILNILSRHQGILDVLSVLTLHVYFNSITTLITTTMYNGNNIFLLLISIGSFVLVSVVYGCTTLAPSPNIASSQSL